MKMIQQALGMALPENEDDIQWGEGDLEEDKDGKIVNEIAMNQQKKRKEAISTLNPNISISIALLSMPIRKYFFFSNMNGR